jgi:hypothetical protein
MKPVPDEDSRRSGKRRFAQHDHQVSRSNVRFRNARLQDSDEITCSDDGAGLYEALT